MKRIIVIICLCSIILDVLLASGFNAESGGKKSKADNAFVVAELKQNIQLMDNVFKSNNKKVYDDKSYVKLSISEKLTDVKMHLFYMGMENHIILQGEYNEVDLGYSKGFVGVYEGVMTPIKGVDYALNDDGMVTVILDVIFTESEVFAVITIGCASEKNLPDIIFYGEYTDLIGKISQVNANEELSYRNNNDNKKEVSASVQAECRYQGCTQIKMANKVVGSISVFHASELRNQSSMSVFQKLIQYVIM